MSLSGTLSGQQSLSSTNQKLNKQPQINLFQKIDILAAELEEVSNKIDLLSQQCHSIRQEKDNVNLYLERKSEENRLRLMGELQLFEGQINKKIQNARAETQKVDERINQMKEGQLYSLQMILALQRRVKELQVQLGLPQSQE